MNELARSLLADDVVILDTETTGLGDSDQIVQLAVISSSGDILIDTLIKPSCPIGEGAIRVHGIGEQMVINAPTFDQVYPDFVQVVSQKRIVVYNAPYDQRLLMQSTRDNDRRWFLRNLQWVDVMMPYAQFWGDWSEWHGNYRWQKLTTACNQQDIRVENAHNALADCRMTLALLKKLAGE